MKLGTRIIISFLISAILGATILFVLNGKSQDLVVITGSVFIVSFVLLLMLLSKYFGEPVIESREGRYWFPKETKLVSPNQRKMSPEWNFDFVPRKDTTHTSGYIAQGKLERNELMRQIAKKRNQFRMSGNDIE